MKVRPEGGLASRRRPCGRGGDLHAKRQARRVRAWAGAQTRKDERGPAWAIFMGFEGAPGLSSHASMERSRLLTVLVGA